MATDNENEPDGKLSKAVNILTAELLTLDVIVNSLEAHAEINLPQEERQSLIKEEVCCCYNQKGWYDQRKSEIMYGADYILERREIITAIEPAEKKTMKKFIDVIERVENYVLTEESRQEVTSYIACHPILSKRLKLELLHQPE